ncbi:collagen alpha-1(I) chain-like [Pteropus medius]|uniref:collagen alpha-1(I) chain-like n=1 Tax=Pteropus vampyrus TaxID=132908 RepID=UPI00196A3B58|nr:collagen alpha-1(I) chain-like [Pteropus giganteus]
MHLAWGLQRCDTTALGYRLYSALLPLSLLVVSALAKCPGSARWTPRSLSSDSGERVGAGPAQLGSFAGRGACGPPRHPVPPGPASGRGPAGREDRHQADGDPRRCGPEAGPERPRRSRVAPAPNPESSGDAGSPDAGPSPPTRLRGPERELPPPPPPPARAPGADAQPAARGGRGAARGAAGAAGRRPGLGLLLRQTPPHPVDPTPCACLPGARARGAALGSRGSARSAGRVAGG